MGPDFTHPAIDSAGNGLRNLIMNKEHEFKWSGVEVKMTTDANGRGTSLELPEHLRPDIEMGADWFEGMILDIRSRVVNTLNQRSIPPVLTDDDIDDIVWRLHKEACYLSKSEPEPSGPKGGRPRDTGAEIAARAALDTADEHDMPGRCVWEDSVSADLLNLIETVSRQYKGRLQPVSFKRRYRLSKGKNWQINTF